MLTYLLDYIRTLINYFYDTEEFDVESVNEKLQEIKNKPEEKYQWLEETLFRSFLHRAIETQNDIKKINPEHKIASKKELKQIFSSYYAIWSPQG